MRRAGRPCCHHWAADRSATAGGGSGRAAGGAPWSSTTSLRCAVSGPGCCLTSRSELGADETSNSPSPPAGRRAGRKFVVPVVRWVR